jgi:hypothetical protein
MVLFGGNNLPFLERGFQGMLSMAGVNTSDLSPEMETGLMKGFIGYTASELLGIEADVGGRIALGNDFLHGLIDTALEPTTLPKALAGASYNTVDKGLKFANAFMNTTTLLDPREEDLTIDDRLIALSAITESLGDLPSSTRNAIAAYHMYHNPVNMNSDGVPIFYGDSNMQTLVAQALGFNTDAKKEYYEMAKIQRGRELNSSEAANSVIYLYRKFFKHGASDEDNYRRYQLAIRAVVSSIDNPEDRAKVIDKVNRKLNKDLEKNIDMASDIRDHLGSQFQDATAKFLPTISEMIRNEQQEPAE